MKRLKERYCLTCGANMDGSGIGNRDWNKKKFCSLKCRRGTNKTPTTKNCQVCGKEMHKIYSESWKSWNKKKFCSRKCVKKGANYRAPSTAFEKGNKPWNIMDSGYGYQAVHAWLRRKYKKNGVCKVCGKKTKTQWANITGKYLKDIDNFVEMCRSCHYYEDLKNPKKPKMYQS